MAKMTLIDKKSTPKSPISDANTTAPNTHSSNSQLEALQPTDINAFNVHDPQMFKNTEFHKHSVDDCLKETIKANNSNKLTSYETPDLEIIDESEITEYMKNH